MDLKCPECGIIFKTKEKLTEHQQTHVSNSNELASREGVDVVNFGGL